MKKISFSVTEEEKKIIDTEAFARGLTLSVYAKTALFSHLVKYGTRSAVAAWVKLHSVKGVDIPDLE